MSLSKRVGVLVPKKGEDRKRLQIRQIMDPATELETAETVGGALRAARLRKGLDIGMVAQHLRIRREFIEAIEENDVTNLPAKTYAIGFVRSYAVHVGLDADECLRRFKADVLHQTEHDTLVFPEAKEEVRLPQGSLLILAALLGVGIYAGWYVSVNADRVATERVPPVPERLAEQISPIERSAPQSDTALASNTPAIELDMAGRPLDVTAVGGPDLELADTDNDNTFSSGLSGPEDSVVMTQADNTDELGTLMAASDEPSVDQEILSLMAGQASRIVLRARSKTWVRIEDATNQILIQQELESGEGYIVPDRPGLILSVRDAGALDVFIDGILMGRLGAPGEALPAVSLDPSALKAGRAS